MGGGGSGGHVRVVSMIGREGVGLGGGGVARGNGQAKRSVQRTELLENSFCLSNFFQRFKRSRNKRFEGSAFD